MVAKVSLACYGKEQEIHVELNLRSPYCSCSVAQYSRYCMNAMV